MKNYKFSLFFTFSLIFLCVSFLATIMIGENYISFSMLFSSLSHHFMQTPLTLNIIDDHIIWYLRLPRAFMAALSGAGLALCSALLQTLLRNPLSEPYILGIGSGASLGIIMTLIFGVSQPVLSLLIGSFSGALLAFLLLFLFLFFLHQSPLFIVLFGLSISCFLNALTSLMLWRYGDIEIRGQLYDWFLGSLSNIGWTEIFFLAPIFVIIFIIFLQFSPFLDAFLLGHDSAKSLGISIKSFTLFLLLLVSILTSAIVSCVGAIGFIGLITPHIARMLVGPKHKFLLYICTIFGAIFMCLSDILSRTLIPAFPIPIGIITALLCSPIFIILMIKNLSYASHRDE